MRNILLSVGVLFGLNGLAAANTGIPAPESIFGQLPDHSGLQFQVYSGGCSNKSDFEVRILESEPLQLELIRLNPDYCRAYLPYGVKIKFTWNEIGISAGEKFTVKNRRRVVTLVP